MTTTTSRIQATPGVLGGDARMGNTRDPGLAARAGPQAGPDRCRAARRPPGPGGRDLDAAWDYFREHPVEVEQAIWFNDTAADVPDWAAAPPAWVVAAGRLQGLTDGEIQSPSA